MNAYIYGLLSVFVVSLISFVGLLTFPVNEKLLKRYVFVLVSLAVGALLGDAFIHLLPEAFERTSSVTTSLLVIGGIFIFLILEKILHWHHHEGIEDRHNHAIGPLVLISDGMHNFTDGLLIGISFLTSVEVGIATTLAVILHEIPQEIGDFGVLLSVGYSKMKALFLNFVSALSAILGVIVAFIFNGMVDAFNAWLLPIAAGGFIYIALSDLLPELQKTKSAKLSILQICSIVVGIGSMILLLFLE